MKWFYGTTGESACELAPIDRPMTARRNGTHQRLSQVRRSAFWSVGLWQDCSLESGQAEAHIGECQNPPWVIIDPVNAARFMTAASIS
jgi:hypothetical protein